MEINISKKNLFKILFKNISLYILSILRKSLYAPYAITLFVYICILWIGIQELFFSNLYLNTIYTQIFIFLSEKKILPPLDSVEMTSNELEAFIVNRMIIFGIFLDFISRIIKYYKENWNRLKTHILLLKSTVLFYLVTGIGIIIFFTIKQPQDFITILLFMFSIIFINILFLGGPWLLDYFIYFLSTKKYSKKLK